MFFSTDFPGILPANRRLSEINFYICSRPVYFLRTTNDMKKHVSTLIRLTLLFLLSVFSLRASDRSQPEFSTAGFFRLDGCWLIAHNSLYITDPNYENETAGGGLLVAFDRVSEQSADVLVNLQVRNETKKPFTGIVEYSLVQPDGRQGAGCLYSMYNLLKIIKYAIDTYRYLDERPGTGA